MFKSNEITYLCANKKRNSNFLKYNKNKMTNQILAFQKSTSNQKKHLSFLGAKKITEFTHNLELDFENTELLYKKFANYPNLTELLDQARKNMENEINPAADRLAFFGQNLGNLVYFHASKEVGLSQSQAKTGIGCIEIDWDYDTIYTIYTSLLSNLTAEELLAIKNHDVWFFNTYLKND